MSSTDNIPPIETPRQKPQTLSDEFVQCIVQFKNFIHFAAACIVSIVSVVILCNTFAKFMYDMGIFMLPLLDDCTSWKSICCAITIKFFILEFMRLLKIQSDQINHNAIAYFIIAAVLVVRGVMHPPLVILLFINIQKFKGRFNPLHKIDTITAIAYVATGNVLVPFILIDCI